MLKCLKIAILWVSNYEFPDSAVFIHCLRNRFLAMKTVLKMVLIVTSCSDRSVIVSPETERDFWRNCSFSARASQVPHYQHHYNNNQNRNLRTNQFWYYFHSSQYRIYKCDSNLDNWGNSKPLAYLHCPVGISLWAVTWVFTGVHITVKHLTGFDDNRLPFGKVYCLASSFKRALGF